MRGVQPPVRRVPEAQRQALEARQAIRHIEPSFFPGSFAYSRQTWRQPPPSVAPPTLHPGLLGALAHAGRVAALAPYHGLRLLMDTEHRMNRYQDLQESLNRDRGGVRIAPHLVNGELGSSAWAWDILNPHGPFEHDRARHLIHPLGG